MTALFERTVTDQGKVALDKVTSDNLGQKLLDQAMNLAKQHQFVAAIETLDRIPQLATVYSQIPALQNTWASEIFRIAQDNYNQGKVSDAIKIAQAIPTSVAIFTEVKQMLNDWKKHEAILKEVDNALNSNDKARARAKLQELEKTPLYETERVRELRARAAPSPSPVRRFPSPSDTPSPGSSGSQPSFPRPPQPSPQPSPRPSQLTFPPQPSPVEEL